MKPLTIRRIIFSQMPFHVHDIFNNESIPDLRTRVREAVTLHLRKLGREPRGIRNTVPHMNDFRVAEVGNQRTTLSNLTTSDSTNNARIAARLLPENFSDTTQETHKRDTTASDRFLLSKIARTKALILAESRRLDALKLRVQHARQARDMPTISKNALTAPDARDLYHVEMPIVFESLQDGPVEISSYNQFNSETVFNSREDGVRKPTEASSTSGSEISYHAKARQLKSNSNVLLGYGSGSSRVYRKKTVIPLKDQADYMGILNRRMPLKLH